MTSLYTTLGEGKEKHVCAVRRQGREVINTILRYTYKLTQNIHSMIRKFVDYAVSSCLFFLGCSEYS